MSDVTFEKSVEANNVERMVLLCGVQNGHKVLKTARKDLDVLVAQHQCSAAGCTLLHRSKGGMKAMISINYISRYLISATYS